MNPEPSAEDALYDAARRLADPGARAAFLEAACAGDTALRGRLKNAWKAAVEIRETYGGVYCYPYLVQALCHLGRFHEAEALLTEQLGLKPA